MDSIKSFWQGSGSFTHHRFSLVPSLKTKIDVPGDEAFLYFGATTSATSQSAASTTPA